MSNLPSQADRVLIFANPKAGARSGRSKVDHLATLLLDVGYRVDLLDEPRQLGEKSASALEAGELRCVVAAGGDGTVDLVVDQTPPGVPISILPLGTENLLAKFLQSPSNCEDLARMIRAGRTMRMDAGKLRDRLFAIMLSCGFDAEVVRRLHDVRRGHIRHFSYAKPIIDSILRYEYPELRLYCRRSGEEGGANEHQFRAHWAFVFNIPAYAGGLGIVPEADASDGMLDVCTFVGGSVWHGLFHLSAIMLGQHRQWSDCVTTRATSVRIESDGQVPYQLDGDPGGFLPVEVSVVPGRLTFVVPSLAENIHELL